MIISFLPQKALTSVLRRRVSMSALIKGGIVTWFIAAPIFSLLTLLEMKISIPRRSMFSCFWDRTPGTPLHKVCPLALRGVSWPKLLLLLLTVSETLVLLSCFKQAGTLKLRMSRFSILQTQIAVSRKKRARWWWWSYMFGKRSQSQRSSRQQKRNS